MLNYKAVQHNPSIFLLVTSVLCLAACALRPCTAFCEDISFEAAVHSAKISLGEAAQLTLTVAGVKEDLGPINLPTVDGFDAKYLGPSTRISIVNGNYHSERSFTYNLFPNKTGHFKIPAITTTIAGQAYATKPIDIEVIPASAQPPAGAQANDNQAPDAQSLQDKVFLKLTVPKTEVYVNEKIPLTVKLFVNGVPMRGIQYPRLAKDGFAMEDFPKPQQYAQALNGVKYDVIEFKTFLTPNRLGELNVGPVQIEANILYKSGHDNPFSSDGPFGDDFFKGFFDSYAYATRPVKIASPPLQLHVLPLPQEHQPPDFTGAVGQFGFNASIAPLQVKVGDPLTLKMSLQGNGNFTNIQIPTLYDPRFKTYDPSIKDEADGKAIEQVIIPVSDKVHEVPALHFSYFDPLTKEYKTLTQGPFAVEVASPGPGQEFKAVGFSDIAREGAAPLKAGDNPFPFKKILGRMASVALKLVKTPWFLVSLVLALGSGIGAYAWRRFQYRLANDPRFARRFKAAKEAKEALVQARGYMRGLQSKEFYALLAKALRDYLANKWHMPSASLSLEEILQQLKARKIEEQYSVQIKALFEESDLVCFASASRDASHMQSDLARAQALIAGLEKYLK